MTCVHAFQFQFMFLSELLIPTCVLSVTVIFIFLWTICCASVSFLYILVVKLVVP